MTANPETARPAKTPPGRNAFKYRPQYALIVPCRTEAEQMRRYARLRQMGMAPKVVCV